MNETQARMVLPFVSLVSIVVTLVALSSTSAHAGQAPRPNTGEVNLTASSANVKEPGGPVRIRILRWSTDEERSPVVAAMNPPAPAGAAAGPAAGAAANPAAAEGSPAAGANPAAGDAGGAARGRRGGAARGGRGGAARGGRGNAGGAANPIAALTAAIGRAPTLGYIWTNDVTGYAIKYAYHASLPDGGERIILATDRRLGAYSAAWNPVPSTTLTDYDFTLVEIRLDAKGSGEGKTSLTTKVILDNQARMVALEDYAATPAVLQNVKR